MNPKKNLNQNQKQSHQQRHADNNPQQQSSEREVRYDLEPLSPEEGIQMYLDHRGSELTEATIKTNKYQLNYLLQWCEKEDVDNLNDLTGRDIHNYRVWMQDGLSRATVRSQLATVRMFLRFCESIDAVEDRLAEKILMPKGGNRRTEKLDADAADELLTYLSKYQYASRDHALLQLLWKTGMRMGAARSLDLNDYDSEGKSLNVEHRPETGTRLKNAEHGERILALAEETCAVLDDYVEVKRVDSTDEYGREPLFSTKMGRIGKATVRRTVYRLTRSCERTGVCPHDKDPETCEAAQLQDKASQCPSSVSPHAIRRGSITHFLLSDVPEKVVSDRMDVSSDILDKHYDQRTEQQKTEQRREFIDGM